MKKLFKELIFYSLPFLGLILILFFINIFKKDFMYGHYLHSTYKDSYNWIYDFTILPINKFYIRVINDNKEYLPQIKLYLSESKLNSFLSDLPKSTKNWQTGKVIHDYDKTNIKDIKIRLRGDNPGNWLLEKQSFRVKLKKNQMHGRYRYYNYLPFEPRTLISNRLAANTKILAAKVRPIELLLNEEKKGLYLELENFNENFLRRNKIMPVNFYKGENYNQETKIGLGNNLYNNTGLWSKEAYFNFYEKSYKDDLRKFLQILKQSKNNPKKFKELKTYLDEEYFGRYLAYIILSQNYHTTKYHNNRIIFDPWKGQIFPVITDPNNSESTFLNFDTSSNDLVSLLNQSSEFLNLKYFYLQRFIFEENIIDNEIYFLNNIKKNIINVLKKDPTKVNIFLDLLKKNENYKVLDKNIENLKIRKKNLITELSKNPKVFWSKNKKNFSIIINSQLPINKVELIYDNQIPDWVFIDENYNNIYDSSEVKFYKEKNKIILDTSLYANRINFTDNNNLHIDNIITTATKHNFVSSNGNMPTNIKISNYFLKNPISVEYVEKNLASQTNNFNNVIFNQMNIDKSDSKVISGKIIVQDELIFDYPVKIEKGTIFLLNEGANIIFKNRVEAIGSKKNKIVFKANSKKPWGTIALLGKKTSGSKFDFVNFSDGSGNLTSQFHFSSMFSIHNTSNIQLKNIDFKNNHFFDDMLHIIYSSNIELENLSFHSAHGDAIDIDICENINIKNSYFYNSNNDGIDLMESKVNINNVFVYNSKDKGLSVGESSVVELKNSKLEKNKTAIAVKDNSKAFVKSVKFVNNEQQISAYKKNLQYGSGGDASIIKSIFESNINIFSAKNSKIKIEDSKIIGKIKKKGNEIYLNERK